MSLKHSILSIIFLLFDFSVLLSAQQVTTSFKPSIHGWPFDNHWKKSIVFESTTMGMGFCAGMSWSALQRFYSAIPIKRDTPDPSEGDPLYEEIWDLQQEACSASELLEIYDWQGSPNLSHDTRKHSLGYRTQEAWPEVKENIDNHKPVTITLIAHANDYDLTDLPDNHRAVAYAYEISAPDSNAPSGATSKVVIWIYDPSYRNDDNVQLSFYLGGDRNRISLSHNRGENYYGFYMDDKNRSYTFSDPNKLTVDSNTISILSRTEAQLNLKLSWRCKFIPYFDIKINGNSWGNNAQASSLLQPIDKNNKQCPERIGNTSISLALTRGQLYKVTVSFLEGLITQDLDIDTRPLVSCNISFDSADIYIGDPKPTQSMINALDNSPFRWIRVLSRGKSGGSGSLERPHIDVLVMNQLGNIAGPVFASFKESNLASPTTLSGTVTITRNGITTSRTMNITNRQKQQFFDGFTNPSDYKGDSKVTFKYQSVDKFGATASGEYLLFGKSIIQSTSTAVINIFDTQEMARMEAAFHRLVEMGLLGPKIPLPIDHPIPSPFPGDLFSRMNSDPIIREKIDMAIKNQLANTKYLNKIIDTQTDALAVIFNKDEIMDFALESKGENLKNTQGLESQIQKHLDGIFMDQVVDAVVSQLKEDKDIKKLLSSDK